MTPEERKRRVERCRETLAGLCNGFSADSARFLLSELDRVSAERDECKRLLLRRVEASRLDAASEQVRVLKEALRDALHGYLNLQEQANGYHEDIPGAFPEWLAKRVAPWRGALAATKDPK